MARYGEVRPVNFFADFMAGKQTAQDERSAARANALADMQFQRSERVNALGQNPNATPEDYIRAGDVQTGAALSGYQQNQQANKQQALTQLAGLAQKALTIQDPAQRKAFLASPEVVQIYGPSFQAIGADHTKGIAELQQLPDAELQQRLSQVAQFAQRAAPVNVAAGGSLVDPSTGKPVYTAPANPTTSQQEYEYAKSQGYKGSFQQYQIEMKRAGATTVNLGAQGLSSPPTGYARPDPLKPGLIIEPGGPADPKNQPPKPPTEGDKKNAVLFSSMMNAEKQIEDLYKKGRTTDTSSIRNQALGSSALTKPLQSEDYRKYESAALRWSANLLYLKSGATATPEEVESTRRQFFPQPGDGPEVKVQKEQARKQEIEAVRQNMVPGAPPPQPPSGGGPAVGTVEDGYRFKGGDPSNKANWEPVR